jgi:DNA-directed RNA polymerase specialized sigma24 family protein
MAADRLGLSPAGVKSRLYRTLRRLRPELDLKELDE